jgi:hypothetical protein
MEYYLQIHLDKLSRTADKGQYSNLEVGVRLAASHRKNVTGCYSGRPLRCCCEHPNEHSDSINGGEILIIRATVCCSRKTMIRELNSEKYC